jgi:hypothetical protein
MAYGTRIEEADQTSSSRKQVMKALGYSVCALAVVACLLVVSGSQGSTVEVLEESAEFSVLNGKAVAAKPVDHGKVVAAAHPSAHDAHASAHASAHDSHASAHASAAHASAAHASAAHASAHDAHASAQASHHASVAHADAHPTPAGMYRFRTQIMGI